MSYWFSLCKEVATFKVMGLSKNLFINLDQPKRRVNILTFFLLPFFSGYAQMTSPIGKDKSPEFGSSSLSGVFSVEWIKKYALHMYF